MAVRHVVMWQLNGDAKEERQAKAVELAGALTELQYVVPGIQMLTAGANALDFEGNWDLVLVADLTDEAALEAYQNHPDHLAVAEKIKAAASSRACVDIEL